MKLSEFITERIAPEFDVYGLELTKILVENISLPPEVEQALDKRTSIGMVGGLDKYIKYQSGQALEEGAKHGGGISDGLGIGVGVALGKQVGDSINSEQQIPENTQQPPQLPNTKRYYIAVNGHSEGPYILDDLKSKAQSGLINADTLIWQPGMNNWQTITEHGDLLTFLFDKMTPPPLPPTQ